MYFGFRVHLQHVVYFLFVFLLFFLLGGGGGGGGGGCRGLGFKDLGWKVAGGGGGVGFRESFWRLNGLGGFRVVGLGEATNFGASGWPGLRAHMPGVHIYVYAYIYIYIYIWLIHIYLWHIERGGFEGFERVLRGC